MPESTALLVSADDSLSQSVRDALAVIPHLRLSVVPQMPLAVSHLQQDPPALLLAHVAQAEDVAAVKGLLDAIASSQLNLPVLVIAEAHTVASSLDLLRRGVVDCLSRPLDVGRLSFLLDTLTIRTRYGAGRTARSTVEVQTLGNQDPILFMGSSAMDALLRQVRIIAPQDTTILLGGETGTGKTRLARLIHELSLRQNEPFLVVNCASLSSNLIESELFGHLRGAFTGADRDRTGKLAAVGEGTLLLDDIDALPPTVQAKLLRAIDERVFEPVGSNKPLPVRARLITASNRRLEDEVAAGRFRADVYYRLNVVELWLPPLRERRVIIPHLVRHWMAEHARERQQPARTLTAEALAALENYDWPGNIREMRNAIERALALGQGPTIDLHDLPPAIMRAASGSSVPSQRKILDLDCDQQLDDARNLAERLQISRALEKCNNNRLRAAAALGISRMTLYNKLRKHGLMAAT